MVEYIDMYMIIPGDVLVVEEGKILPLLLANAALYSLLIFYRKGYEDEIKLEDVFVKARVACFISG